MPKSKKRKDHKKKVEVRNTKIKESKKSNEKAQREFLMNLIKREQESGLFDSNNDISIDNNNLSVDGPVI